MDEHSEGIQKAIEMMRTCSTADIYQCILKGAAELSEKQDDILFIDVVKEETGQVIAEALNEDILVEEKRVKTSRDGMSGLIIYNRKAIFYSSNDADVPDKVRSELSRIPVENFRSFMAVPIFDIDRAYIYAIIYACNSDPAAYDEPHRSKFELFAHIAGIIIQTKQFRADIIDKSRQVSELRKQLGGLARQSRVMSTYDWRISESISDWKKIAKNLLDECLEVLGNRERRCVFVVRYYKDKDKLEVELGGGGIYNDKLNGHKYEVDNSFTGQVVRDRTSRITVNTAHEPQYYSAIGIARSEMAVPIIINDQVFGVLDAESSKTADFSESDLAKLEEIAGHVALLIETAGRRSASTPRVEEVLTNIVDSLDFERSPKLRDLTSFLKERMLMRALKESNYNNSATASMLGISEGMVRKFRKEREL